MLETMLYILQQECAWYFAGVRELPGNLPSKVICQCFT